MICGGHSVSIHGEVLRYLRSVLLGLIFDVRVDVDDTAVAQLAYILFTDARTYFLIQKIYIHS